MSIQSRPTKSELIDAKKRLIEDLEADLERDDITEEERVFTNRLLKRVRKSSPESLPELKSAA